MNRSRRQFVRAPLRKTILYVDEGHVHSADGLNISQSGLFVARFPRVPQTPTIPLMISLPILPPFEELTKRRLLEIDEDFLPSRVVRVRGEITRSFTDRSEVDQIFIRDIGIKFVNPSPLARQKIEEYTRAAHKNLAWLLKLFEDPACDKALFSHLVKLMGHSPRLKRPLLRAKMLHEYQSASSAHPCPPHINGRA